MALCPEKEDTGDKPPSDCMKESCTLSRPLSKPDWKASMYLQEHKDLHQPLQAPAAQ